MIHPPRTCRRLAAFALPLTVAAWMAAGTASCARRDAAGPPDPSATLDLAYVANEGVMLSSGGRSVLIDALFAKPNPDYRAPSPEVLDAMLKREAPYDRVDLVLVTHAHPDHFDASVVARYLEGSPGTVLVAPSDAVADLEGASTDWSKIAPRVVSLDVAVGERAESTRKGVRIEAYRTRHSGESDSPMNLMYLVDFNGWRVFHEGDSDFKPEAYGTFGLDRAEVDLALVHFWFPLEPDHARFLQEFVKASHVALIHLPIRLEGDAPGKVALVSAYYPDLFLLLPGMPPRTLRR